MEETNNDKITQMICSFSDFKDEMIKSMNYIRGDIKDLKDEVKDLKGDFKDLKKEVKDLKKGVKDLKEEFKEFKEETNKRWDANDKKWEKYEENRVKDRDTILGILLNYDISISEQLGDPNVEKMRKIV